MGLPQPTVRIAFDLSLAGLGDFFTIGQTDLGDGIDSAPLLGPTPQDVTEFVRSISIRRGRSKFSDTFDAGQATIVLDNRARTFDPSNLGFTFNQPGVIFDDPDVTFDDLGFGSPFAPSMTPRKAVTMEVGGQLLMTGIVEDYDLAYSPDGDSTCTVKVADGFTLIAQAQLTAGTPVAEDTGARIGAVLDDNNVAWPPLRRQLDTGLSTVGTAAIGENQNALQYLNLVNASEPGAVFIDRRGFVRFRNRSSLQSATGLVFSDDADTRDQFATGGNNVYETTIGSLRYRVHEFTSVGTATFTPSGTLRDVEYLVVAGGGGGGRVRGGGGGAGGLVTNFPSSGIDVSSPASVVVGAGGVGASATTNTNGANSAFGSVTAIGGGRGGRPNDPAVGGSGGGGGGLASFTGANGTASQGNKGGNGTDTANSGGGGGGAGAAGQDASGTSGGNGGAGVELLITGTPRAFAGGGGGMGGNTGGVPTVAALGGGGVGATTLGGTNNATSGQANTGGGGGGANNATGSVGGNGGSGIVIVRYPLANALPFSAITREIGTEQLYTQINVNYPGGTETANDLDAQDKYGITALNWNTLLDSQAAAEGLAEYWARRYSAPTTRLDGVDIIIDGLSATQRGQVLALELGDLVSVRFTPNGIGNPLEQAATVEQITHDITPGGHRVRLGLISGLSGFIIGESILGEEAVGF